MPLYFNDNFFSNGETQVMDAHGKQVGSLDLKTLFNTSLSVYAPDQWDNYSGKFRFFSRRWEVSDYHGHVVGVLKMKYSWLNKRYQYDAGKRGMYKIESPAFSKAYSIMDSRGTEVAHFERTSSWIQSGAFRLDNHSSRLNSYELIAIIMGVHSINKMMNSAAASS